MGTQADGRSTRWDDHRAARRAELIRAASRAVHHHGPGVSMDEIAAASGTSKSIVYRYFEDRTGLQLAVGSAVVDRMRDALTEAAVTADTPQDALRAMVRVYLETIESSPNVYYFVTRTSAVVGTEPPDATGPGRRGPGGAGHGGAGDDVDDGVTGDPAGRAPLAAFLDSVIDLVAEPLARTAPDADPAHEPAAPDHAADPVVHAIDPAAAAWAAGAVGFVRGAGEWWLARRGRPDVPSREVLTEQVSAWLCSGPASLLPGDAAPTPPA